MTTELKPLPPAWGYARNVDGTIEVSVGATRPPDRAGGYATPWAPMYGADAMQAYAREHITPIKPSADYARLREAVAAFSNKLRENDWGYLAMDLDALLTTFPASGVEPKEDAPLTITGDKLLAHNQCLVVAHLATTLAAVYTDKAQWLREGRGVESVAGPTSAAAMETLGDMLNGMDAADDIDDAWCTPVFEAAQERWPQPANPGDGGAVPVAWLHTVVQDDGEEDLALSFAPDNFPLQGVSGFRSLCHEPLFKGPPRSIEPTAAQPRAVPEGWVVVPTKPTEAMALAACKDHEGEHFLPYSLWRSMLAAAPTPPATDHLPGVRNMVAALDVFRTAGGDVECSPDPSAEQAMECLRDLRRCYDEALSGAVADPWRGLYLPEKARLDAQGLFLHPDLPTWDDDREESIGPLLRAQGFEARAEEIEVDDDIAMAGDDRYWQALAAWRPERLSNNWRLAAVADTEDGPAAWFVRPLALAGQAEGNGNG